MRCSSVGTILRVRLEWKVSECVNLRNMGHAGGVLVKMYLSLSRLLSSLELSFILALPFQLFFPFSILTHLSFLFNENNSNSKWKLSFNFTSPFLQPNLTEESSELISSTSSLPISVSPYFSLVVIPVASLKQLSPSSLCHPYCQVK